MGGVLPRRSGGFLVLLVVVDLGKLGIDDVFLLAAVRTGGRASAGGGGAAGTGSEGPKGEHKEDVVDAEFTEVDDDKKNKKSA